MSKMQEKIKNAIYSDETESYRIPWMPKSSDTVRVRIRVLKGSFSEINMVILGEESLPMSFEFSKGIFDYYFVELPPAEDAKEYLFELINEDIKFYYNRLGIFEEDMPKKGMFSILRDFYVPEWFIGAVMYQIFVDRFNSGTYKNRVVDNEYVYLGKPVKYIKDWNETPKEEDIRNFYGGDIQGILNKMDYLEKLGIEAIYLNPVFVSPSNHKYDIQDYDYIDPHYGLIAEDGGEALRFERFNNSYASKYIKRTTDKKNLEASNRIFSELTYVAHEKGMKIIIDGVFNHCGAANKWLDKEGFYKKAGGYKNGAYKNPESEYADYFCFLDEANTKYEGWWGYENHPKLNFEKSKELYEYFMGLGKKWLSKPLDADGWRLDVAADLGRTEEFNHKFWKDFRKSIKSAKEDAVIIAEHYGNPRNWLNGKEWDTIMNYDAFMEPLTRFLTGMEKHSDDFSPELYCNGKAFEKNILEKMSDLPCQSLYTAMNQLSNHDHSRFLTRTNMTPGRLSTKGSSAASEGIDMGIMREAVIFQMTWVGAPAIYYGDEAGLTGWTDPDNRRTYPWGREDKGLIDFHRLLINIRKNNSVLKKGGLKILLAQSGIFAYARFDFENQFIVVLNNNKRNVQIKIPVWEAGAEDEDVFESLISTDEFGFYESKEMFAVKDGYIFIDVSPRGSFVLKKILE